MIKMPSTVTAAAFAALLQACATPAPAPVAQPADITSADVPEPFWDFDPTSNYAINYGDVDTILATLVVNMGRSERDSLPALRASTGTRLQAKTRRKTANEGNRFHFEELEDNEEFRQVLRVVRENLEAIPDQMPLEKFNREEQLAYWLNLYNIAMLDQLVGLYPESNLEKELTGKDSILDTRFLNVSGVPLSLNDIQHTILRWNYDDNPLVIYGLYQGIIGGPNIRPLAYTGESVYRDLVDNAEEFVNSNRGTYMKGGSTFHVSSFYARNQVYFDDMEAGLKAHLLEYIEGTQRQNLLEADRIVADIDDWTITDISGGQQQVTRSFAQNAAGMLGATQSRQPGDVPGTSVSTSFTIDSFTTLTRDPTFSRFERDALRRVSTLESTDVSSGGRVQSVGDGGDSESAPAQPAEVPTTEEDQG